ncbi:hypothetical protein GW17_00057651 [Ensete ventricosum]|nr:hypothetical protein GW17_00057651 [Ensete ventricosum]
MWVLLSPPRSHVPLNPPCQGAGTTAFMVGAEPAGSTSMGAAPAGALASGNPCRRPAYGRRACRRYPYWRLPLQPGCGLLPTFDIPCRKLATGSYPLQAASVVG